MRIVAVLLVATSTLGCSSSVARAPNVEFACEAERCALRFQGNAQVSDAELAAEITQHDPHPRELSREVVPVLVKAAYYDRGFIDVRVDARPEPARDGGHVLVVAVDEGNPYWVHALRVSDPANLPGEPLGDAAVLRAAISQSEGAVFARHVMIDDLRAVLSRYREMGYAWADADVAVRKDGHEHFVVVDITIVRGPATVVDRVDVHGAEGLPERALQERLVTHPGETYRASAIEASSRGLAELAGAGRRVDVRQSPVEGHPDRVAVTFGITWAEVGATDPSQ
jgi:outer membrane protein assembly factor BamA